VDIRSDLYSLGVTLWVMVTGQTPFRGTSAEVMYHHQHAPLPRERLKDVPQPVVILLEKLLEKDPERRFQNPGELLKRYQRYQSLSTHGAESLVRPYRRRPLQLRVSELVSPRHDWVPRIFR
jgi:serine/threonine protein kinase